MCPVEQDFYDEISLKLGCYMEEILPEGYEVAFSKNKPLGQMIEELQQELSGNTAYNSSYIPNLQLDILMDIKIPDGTIKLCLIEVKYSKNLSLINYSQLVGYLQVAKKIPLGLLLLVVKNPRSSNMSNDFSEILNTNYLPMDWHMFVREGSGEERYDFRVGICGLTPNNGFHWIRSSSCYGISSWEELSLAISE